VGLENEQSLLHFLSESPWQVKDLREQRLKLILQVLRGREINLIIDETGDRKNVVAIRSNHAVWLPQGQRVRQNQWHKFDRVFSDGSSQQRYIREIIFGKRHEMQYWQITNDPEALPKNFSWYYVVTKVPGVKYKEVGNLYGLRNWVEYGLKQIKNELGWADFRVTNYPKIKKW
jgi:SRSO17 transposase